MMTLRPTQKLLKKMHLTVEDLKDAVTPPPTTALGDWYANFLILQRQHTIICVSERSRLCLLTTARDMDRFTTRFHHAVAKLLHDIGVPEEAIKREETAMQEMCFGLTVGTPNGRSVLGTINDYTNALHHFDLAEWSLPDLSIRLSNHICSPLNYKKPRAVSLALLTSDSQSQAG